MLKSLEKTFNEKGSFAKRHHVTDHENPCKNKDLFGFSRAQKCCAPTVTKCLCFRGSPRNPIIL